MWFSRIDYQFEKKSLVFTVSITVGLIFHIWFFVWLLEAFNIFLILFGNFIFKRPKP